MQNAVWLGCHSAWHRMWVRFVKFLYQNERIGTLRGGALRVCPLRSATEFGHEWGCCQRPRLTGMLTNNRVHHMSYQYKCGCGFCDEMCNRLENSNDNKHTCVQKTMVSIVYNDTKLLWIRAHLFSTLFPASLGVKVTTHRKSHLGSWDGSSK